MSEEEILISIDKDSTDFLKLSQTQKNDRIKEMRVIAKYPIKIGKILIPKGTEGKTKSLAESPEIKDFFTEIKEEINGAYCIVSFPGTKDCLVYPSQLVFL